MFPKTALQFVELEKKNGKIIEMEVISAD